MPAMNPLLSISSRSKPPLEGYVAYSVPPTKLEKLFRINRPAPADEYCAEKDAVAVTFPALLTSSVEALVMLPAPSVTMNPPAEIGAVVPPCRVNAMVPAGMVGVD